MLRVAIVDDSPEQIILMEAYLNRYISETSVEVHWEFFSDGDEIASGYKPDYDVIFFDIAMKRLDGMSAAKQIRSIDKKVIIVFITNLSQYAIKGYEVAAFNYILKPVSYFAFATELNRIIASLSENKDKSLTIKTSSGLQILSSSDILYIEVNRHILSIHLKSKKLETSGALKEFEDRLSATTFCRCNHCYLVNLCHVKGIEGDYVIVGEKRLVMSRNRKKPFMERLAAYCGGTIR